ncbi:MAG: YdcF family protein [Lachnospiraceae bacterium]|nr:YdcF family protein [Lachnospiraceae bacterium]
MRRRKREELVPYDKTKRVIYVYRRGKKRSAGVVVGGFLLCLGVLCLLYCLFIFLFVRFGSWFFLTWGVGGLALMIWGGLLRGQRTESMPRWLKFCWGLLVAVGLTALVAVEGLILTQFGAEAQPGADYCVILGAQIRENGPSDVLKRRLDRAVVYLRQNPDTQVIVSGCQGSNEPMSEARGMYDYLVAAGIAPERIHLEEASRNTCENLELSGNLLNRQADSVVLVTNNFHMYRALHLAAGAGYEHVQGLSASSYPWTLPNNMLREFMGVVKDFLAGHF